MDRRADRHAGSLQGQGISSHFTYIEGVQHHYIAPSTDQVHQFNSNLPRIVQLSEPSQQVCGGFRASYGSRESPPNIHTSKLPLQTAEVAVHTTGQPTGNVNSQFHGPMNPIAVSNIDAQVHVALQNEYNIDDGIVAINPGKVGKQSSHTSSSGQPQCSDLTSAYHKTNYPDSVSDNYPDSMSENYPDSVSANSAVAGPPHTPHCNPKSYPFSEHLCHCLCQIQLLYRCGACGKTLNTVCKLHLHIQGHGTSGVSYHYDHRLRTAFPKFGAICQFTQTADDEAKTLTQLENVSAERSFGLCSDTGVEDNSTVDDSSVLHENSEAIHVSTVMDSTSTGNDVSKEVLLPSCHDNYKESNQRLSEVEAVIDDDFECDGDSTNEDIDTSKISNICKKKLNGKVIVKIVKKDGITKVSNDGKGINKVLKSKGKKKKRTHSEKKTSAVRSKKKKREKIKSVRANSESGCGNVNNVYDEESNGRNSASSVSCAICLETFSSQKELSTHKKSKHKMKVETQILDCKWCFQTFETNKIRLTHEKQCQKNDNLKCYICEKICSCKSELDKHLQVHRNREDLTCKICSKSFSNEISMRAHIRRHVQPRTIQCEQCGKAFFYSHMLKKHMVYCNNERTVKCPDCDLTFKTKESLKHHSSVHRDEKPFVCHICGYAGKKYMYLKRHIRSHTGEKPYACKICNMRFSALNGLNRHNKLHTNTKTCVCSYCNKSFTNNWNLKTHLRQHTGENPYTCEHCGQGFKQNVLLKLHMKSHHSPCV